MNKKKLMHITLLGRLAVRGHPSKTPLPPSKKTRALLAYLAVTARAHSRDRLCAMFWDISDDPRASLRWSLCHLRPLVDEPDCRRIVADREKVGLNLNGVTVDILSLPRVAGNGIESISTEALSEAAKSLEDEFLEGLDLPDCREFQNWCIGEREATRRLRVQILTALIARLERTPADALPYARALGTLEPANEAVQATLVRLLRASGLRHEAADQLQRAQKALKEHNIVSTGILIRAAQLSIRHVPSVSTQVARTHCASPAAAVADSAAIALPRWPKIAVLPLANLSHESGEERVADGITEDIHTALTRLRWLRVAALNSSFADRNGASDFRRTGEELDVRYVLEGTVGYVSRRLRISIQLVDTQTSAILWADRFHRDVIDTFVAQDDIVAAIFAAVHAAIVDAERRRIFPKPTQCLDAWESYQRGLWLHARRDAAEADEVCSLFKRSIELDPKFAAAYLGLASAHVAGGLVFRTVDYEAAMNEAEALTRKAIELDDGDVSARASLGYVCRLLGKRNDAVRQAEAAMRHAEHALRLDPTSAEAHGLVGSALTFTDRYDQARQALEMALRLGPRDARRPIWRVYSAMTWYFERRYAEAAEAARRAVNEFPSYAGAHQCLAEALGQLGDAEGAAGAVRRYKALAPKDSLLLKSPPPFYSLTQYDHCLEGFRKAGWTG